MGGGLCRLKGVNVNFDDEETEEKITRESLSARHEEKKLSRVQDSLWYLSEESKRTLYDGLKKHFERAAEAATAAESPTAPAPKGPTP